MIEFGETLRKAREARGLTTGQVADSTHMMVQMVEDLENEDFSKIAAPIYGRGFVKLYCEAVGLDPKPLIAEFMDIFNGNRPPAIRLKPPVSAAAKETKQPAERDTTAAPEAASAEPPRPRHQTADSLLMGRYAPAAGTAGRDAPIAPQQSAASTAGRDAPIAPQSAAPFVLEQETIAAPAARDLFDNPAPQPAAGRSWAPNSAGVMV